MSTVVGDGLFTRGNLRAALAAVCAEIGVDPRGARLLRFTNNAVFRLAAEPVVVRIVGSVSLRHRVHKVVRVARWLAEHEIPAVRLVDGVEHPVSVGPYTATVWDAVPGFDREPRPADLARLLRRIHPLPPPVDVLPRWDPLDDVRKRVGEAEGLAEDVRGFLRERCDEVAGRLAELRFPLPTGFVHGDAHLGNLIPAPVGGPVLCDFDSSCVGPPEWDLTPVAVGVSRFGEPPAHYRELAAAYGFDVTRWDGFAVLREVRELKLITSVLPIMNSSPEVRPELLRRLHDFRVGDTSAQWSRYT